MVVVVIGLVIWNGWGERAFGEENFGLRDGGVPYWLLVRLVCGGLVEMVLVHGGDTQHAHHVEV